MPDCIGILNSGSSSIKFSIFTVEGEELRSSIRGQIEAVERALDHEIGCADVLQLIAGARGAINGLMAEVMEGHVRFHVVNPDHRPGSGQAKAAQELIDVVKRYLR